MDVIRMKGGSPLVGTVAVSGSKNAALPILAASLLASEPVALRNVPQLLDTVTLMQVLARLGMRIERTPDGQLHLETIDERPTEADATLVRQMRASFCVLGPLLARRKQAVVPLPGGCSIGPRPVDLHLAGLAALGADIRIRDGYVLAASKQLRGAEIELTGPCGPTVTGTANVLCAAVLARGTTVLRGAALEPEIVALGEFLNRMGARIEGLGASTLIVQGVDELAGASFTNIPDRIEAATLLAAGAITAGQVTVQGAQPRHLTQVLAALAAMGANVEIAGDRIVVAGPERLQAAQIVALPYPGVPTDMQAQLMALASVAEGTSVIGDFVFPHRFRHAVELNRLGASIEYRDAVAIVDGQRNLRGGNVRATDLRASAALLLAGLVAQRPTTLHAVAHLDRGYERLDQKLMALGAQVQRCTAQAEERVDRHVLTG